MKNRFLICPSPYRFALFGASLLLISANLTVWGQSPQKLSKRYPAGKNVRIELKNVSGTIEVESWNKDEIKLTATMESPTAHVVPRQYQSSLVVDVMGDNRERGTSAT